MQVLLTGPFTAGRQPTSETPPPPLNVRPLNIQMNREYHITLIVQTTQVLMGVKEEGMSFIVYAKFARTAGN